MWSRAELPWLPSPPNDFRAQIKSLHPGTEKLGARLRWLASHRMTPNELSAFARIVTTLASSGAVLEPLQPIKLVILSTASTELIRDGLIGTGPRHGLSLDVMELPFGSVEMQVLDPNSEFNRSSPNIVMILGSHNDYFDVHTSAAGDRTSIDTAARKCAERIAELKDKIIARHGVPVITHTFISPPETLLGSADRLYASRRFFSKLNEEICGLAGGPNLLLDIESIAQTVGVDAWADPIQWHAYKLPFAQRFVPLFADTLCRLLAAQRGLSKKCLVLDLDNTVWGGVIGDDGIEGIKVGQGSAEGEAFLDVQRLAIALRRRGVVLAVCSKNNDETARLPLQQHEDMLLREQHIAVFQANWQDKASNLRAIAKRLEFSTDALVFLDDNPAERAQVRAELPDVGVPELPDDPAYYSRVLSAAGYFESIGISDEDLQRAGMYQENAARAELLESMSDMPSFLKNLAMEIQFDNFSLVARSRITQLVNKSNQFNLTTRRYSESEIERAEIDPSVFTLQVRLRDRFGDAGLIAVIIARAIQKNGLQAWEFDTWLMSCRVLGRRVEEATLAEVVRSAREAGVSVLIGRYLPTTKNGMVRDHFAKLGFKHADGPVAGPSEWHLDVSSYVPSELPMHVVRKFQQDGLTIAS